MTTRTTLIGAGYDPIAAGSTAIYKAQFFDESGNPIGANALSTVTLSIVDTLSGAVINGCNAANILNAGRGTVDSAGNLLVTLGPGDTALYNPASLIEERSLIIDWTYSAGSKTGRHQADFQIQALSGA